VEGVCLEVHFWEDVVDELDIRLFAAEQSRESRQSALARALWVEIDTQLAVWDPEVVTAYFGQSLDEVLEPRETLAGIAVRRAWRKPLTGDPAELWASGITATRRQVSEHHVSALVVAGDDRAVERRLWAAELRVLFPILELRRHELLTNLDGSLRVPFRSQAGGVIEQLADLELGHIEYQLSVRQRFRGTKVLKNVSLCKSIRNHLAHLEPVPVDTLRAAITNGALETFV